MNRFIRTPTKYEVENLAGAHYLKYSMLNETWWMKNINNECQSFLVNI